MHVHLIAAISDDNVIGVDGKIPWRIPEDLAHFRRCTVRKAVIMGRRTLESLGEPLWHRLNIVVQSELRPAPGTARAASVREAVQLAELCGYEEAWLIGGAGVYREGLEIADSLWITRVHQRVALRDDPFNTTVYFPIVDWSQWELVGELAAVRNTYEIQRYRRHGAQPEVD